jgi:PhzF family phenazine biosynthesis protein
MSLALYQIDAFTDRLFGGNPAAVIPLEQWLPNEVMQRIALENNLSETAFFVPAKGADYHLRWFTPVNEVKLCGHATLATAQVIFSFLRPELESIRFDSLSGLLTVTRENDLLTLDFPAWKRQAVPMPSGLTQALGMTPLEFFTGDYFMAVLENEAQIAALQPDFHALKKLVPAGLIATALGHEVDFVSRSFFPAFAIDEDPVTGSSHCMLTPYWAERLGKATLTARQISPRGGALGCRIEGERVFISGKAVLYLRGEIFL